MDTRNGMFKGGRMSQNTTDQMMIASAEEAIEVAFQGDDQEELTEAELRQLEEEVEEGLQAFLSESWESGEERVDDVDPVLVNAQKPGASERVRKLHLGDVARGKRRTKRNSRAKASASPS